MLLFTPLLASIAFSPLVGIITPLKVKRLLKGLFLIFSGMFQNGKIVSAFKRDNLIFLSLKALLILLQVCFLTHTF